MVNIIKESSSFVIQGDVNSYPFKDGKISLPLNSLYFVIDESNVISFKQTRDNNTLLSVNINNLQINGEQVTKENLIEKFDAVANGSMGGSKINAGTNITLQPEADGSITISATGELGGTVAWQDVTDKPSTFTPSAHNHVVADITDLQGKLDAKQDTLVSGTNIKTINGQDILGEGNIEIQGGTWDVTKQYVDEQLALKVDKSVYDSEKANFALKSELPDISKLATKFYVDEQLTLKANLSDIYFKQDTLVSGENIKTINGESLLGSGNIEIQGGGGGIADAPSDGKKYVRQNANWVEETTVDTSNFATKEELAGKANSSDLSNYLTTSVAESTYAKESSLEELKTSKLDVSTYNQDKETFALKTEIPNDYLTDADLTDYLTKDEASDTYRQKKIINFNRTNRSTEITNAWANSLNNIGATFQYVSFDEGATYNNVLYCGYRSYDGAGNRKGVGITEIDGKMRSVIFEFSGIDCVATLEDEIDLSDYATKSELATKQDKLVSGESIKTINGQTLLGSGDITIEAGTSGVTKEYVDEQLALKADKTSVPTAQSSSMGKENNYVYSIGYIEDKKNVLSIISVDSQSSDLNLVTQTWNNDTKKIISIRNASSSKSGAMSFLDKQKLDSINTEEILTKTEAASTYALQTALQEALNRISALETQVGNISTQLDNINGEIV